MKKLPPKAPTWTAIVLVLLGLFTIFLAWNGAAGIPLTQAQLPYLISGGLTGVCLVGAGLSLLRTFEARRDAAAIVARLEQVQRAVEALGGAAPAVVDPTAAVAGAAVPAALPAAVAVQAPTPSASFAPSPALAPPPNGTVAPPPALPALGSLAAVAPPRIAPPPPAGAAVAVPPVPSLGDDDPTLVAFQPQPSVSANGSATDGVVLGGTSYHDPSCRTVVGRDDLQRASLGEASRRGLTPCRVCNPAEVPAS